MLLLALLSSLSLAGAPSPADTLLARACQGKAASAKAAGTRAFVALLPAAGRSRDTVTAVLCIVSPAGDAKFGSYHGELSFDSTAARIVRVEKVAGGMRVENTRRAGYVNFAGAAPEGFAEGPQLGFVVSVARQATPPAFRLRMLELNSVRGEDLMPTLVAGAK